MRTVRVLIAASVIAGGLAWGVGAVPVAANTPEALETDSPGACSHQRNGSAPAPPDADASSTPPNPDGPTVVGMAFYINELRDIDAVRDEYTFRGYVRTTWCDPRLAFDRAEAGRDARTTYGAAAAAEIQKIWFPSAFPVDEVEGFQVLDRELRVRHDGTVQSNVNLSVRVVARFDLRRFPFDHQRLELAIESFRWPDDSLVFVAEPRATDFAHDFSIPEWWIEGVSTRVEESHALRSAKPFSRLVLEIDVDRRGGFYLWKILLPVAVIVALSWTIFWMSDETAVNRIRLTATGVLTIVAYQFVVGRDLPRIAYLTILDKVMLVSFLLLAITAVPSLIVSYARADDMLRAKRVDRISRAIFPTTYVLLLLLIAATSGR
jgi:hypothetical protein